MSLKFELAQVDFVKSFHDVHKYDIQRIKEFACSLVNDETNNKTQSLRMKMRNISKL